MKIFRTYFILFFIFQIFFLTGSVANAGKVEGFAKKSNIAATDINKNIDTGSKKEYPNLIAFVKPNTFLAGTISVFPLRIYDNEVVGGAIGTNRKITVKNTGSDILLLSSVNITGTNNSQFVLSGLPTFPKNINGGDSISFFVAFNPSSTGIKTATIIINSDDALNPAFSIPLRGLGMIGYGSVNEPSLQTLLNLLQIEANVGDDSVSTPVINSDVVKQKAQILGDEVSLQKFTKAGAGNVTITPLAVFGPTDSATVVGMGWYKSGNISTKTELFTVPNSPFPNGQSVNVRFTGNLSFDPLTDTFGFYSNWPRFNNRHLYSEDNLNTFSGSAPHHVRVYPYRMNGVLIPNTYLVVFEENTTRLDYNDLMFVVSNVKKVQSNALIFIENMDKFPSNDQLVFSRLQIPWSRDSINYNSNHDSIKVRIHNKGISPLTVSKLAISNDTTWKIELFNGTIYVPGSGLPVNIASGASIDMTLRFIAQNQASRVKVLRETLIITSNDDKFPLKIIYLNGLWQESGEGNSEPYAQEIINAFGYKTQTGFGDFDPDLGDTTKLKGDEIKPSFFIRADATRPVSIRQLAAYHGCCTQTENLEWYSKGSSTNTSIFTQIVEDGQTLLPRRSLSGNPAGGAINPNTAFGFKVGFSNYTEATRNPGDKIGIRIWKAINSAGKIIPDSYIISADYLGTSTTNFDYQDNTYFLSNLKPETGSAFYSALAAAPSALDFGEKVLQSGDSLLLNISSLGKVYPDGSSDPAILISAVEITGENNAEFLADPPLNDSLNPQQLSTIKVRFTPLSQGLKIADLLIHYNSSLSPLRVPLYGIAKAADTIVVVNYRIKSGTPDPITINGKTWMGDTPYAFDNLEPYANASVTQIAATDEDSLYLIEQSSNGNKRPFRYEIPVPNGKYSVRLHFAEIYWGVPGGAAGEAGARVMGVTLENQLRLINFDIVEEVGSAEAIIVNFPVTVTDGKLNINFSASVNRPSLSAVEVYSFVSSGPLAVDQFNLKGSLKDGSVNLTWINTNEGGTKYYEIQRSANNIDFSFLGKVYANNAGKYNFTDSTPTVANNFYRIRKVSLADKSAYSKIIRIDLPAIFRMKLSPNPATNLLDVQLTGVSAHQKANLTIENITGSKMKIVPLVLSGQKITIDISTLSSGTYIIRITGTDFTLTGRFLKK